MSATMALQKQVDEFEKLKALLEAADVRKIAAAAEETRKQIKLNNDLEAELAEARAFIANHKTLKAEIDAGRLQNEQDKAANQIEKNRLAELDKKLKSKQARLLAAASADD